VGSTEDVAAEAGGDTSPPENYNLLIILFKIIKQLT
jgi:hypothetical protein